MQQKPQKGRFTESKTKEENVKRTNQETRKVTGGKTDNSQQQKQKQSQPLIHHQCKFPPLIFIFHLSVLRCVFILLQGEKVQIQRLEAATVTLVKRVIGDDTIKVIEDVRAFLMVALETRTTSAASCYQLLCSKRLWCIQTAIKQQQDGVSLLSVCDQLESGWQLHAILFMIIPDKQEVCFLHTQKST